MENEFLYDVFLSHNRKDKNKVREIANQLKESGLRVWFDEWIINAGDDIFSAIEDGLQKSRILILFMSQAAFKSDWVSLERNTALFRDPTNKKRRFIPVLLEDCDIPDVLKRISYIDLRIKRWRTQKILISECVRIIKNEGTEGLRLESDQESIENVFDVETYISEIDRLYVEANIESWYVPLDGLLENENGQKIQISLDDYIRKWLEGIKGHLAA